MRSDRRRPFLPSRRQPFRSRINFRLLAHLGFCTAFALTAHPVSAVVKDGKVITVMLCSEPGVYRKVTIPIGDSGQQPYKNGPDGTKPCHAMCCSRRGDPDETAGQ